MGRDVNQKWAFEVQECREGNTKKGVQAREKDGFQTSDRTSILLCHLFTTHFVFVSQ